MSAIPTGNIQFLSNASSVCQVFNLGTANVSMSSLVGKKTKASEIAFSSNTLALPISLRSLAGVTPVNITQIPPMPIWSEGSIIFQNSNSVLTYEGSGGPTPSPLTWYFGIGTSPGTFNKLSLTNYNPGYVWIGDINTSTLYYISALYSNTTTGEKGIAISNPQGVYAFSF